MPLIAKILSDMGYQKAKLKASAENLSRAAIPGERELVVEKPNFQTLLTQIKTNPRHISKADSHGGIRVKEGGVSQSTDPSLSKNTIDADKQLGYAAEANLELARDIALLGKIHAQLRIPFDK